MTNHPMFWPWGQRVSLCKLGNGPSKATKLWVPHARNSSVYTSEKLPGGILKPPGTYYLSSHRGTKCVEPHLVSVVGL